MAGGNAGTIGELTGTGTPPVNDSGEIATAFNDLLKAMGDQTTLYTGVPLNPDQIKRAVKLVTALTKANIRVFRRAIMHLKTVAKAAVESIQNLGKYIEAAWTMLRMQKA